MAKEKKQKVQKQKTRKMNIKTKILLPVLIIILIVSAGMGVMIYLIGETAYVKAGVEQSHLAATIASSMIDGSKVLKVHDGTADQDLYENELRELREIKETCGIDLKDEASLRNYVTGHINMFLGD